MRHKKIDANLKSTISEKLQKKRLKFVDFTSFLSFYKTQARHQTKNP